ncbi:MAG: cytochrome c biogenesis protein CcdC [Deltaproteobacteria bacterium]|nr:cytochrome c biogenesis protein CcdC [Deltaproteobacteria bacterium]
MSPALRVAFILVSIAGAVVVISWRMRETSRPIDARKILIPPLGMSTGFAMFVYPPTRIPILWAAVAFLFGALVLCYPLAKSSELARVGDEIRLRRSPAFLWILFALVTIRFAARTWVEHYVSPLQTGSIFFVTAFGMILPWRLLMYRKYKRLVAQRESEPRAGEGAGPGPAATV